MENEKELFTLNDNRTLQEMLDNYHQKQEELQQIESLNELSEEQEKAKEELSEEVASHKDFLEEMNKSLDFTLATTSNQLVITEENGKRVPESETKSLLEKKEYTSLVTTLTDGLNPDLTLELDRARAENFEENRFYSSPKEFEENHLAPIADFSVLKNEIEKTKEQEFPDGVLVSDAVQAIGETKELAVDYARAIQVPEQTVDDMFRNPMHEVSLAEMTDVANAEFQNERLNDNLKTLVTAEEKNKFNSVDLAEVQALYNDGYRSEDKEALMADLNYNERKAETVCVVLDEMERNGITPELLENIDKALEENDLDDNGVKVNTDDIEIVESNDGYVIATSEITPENEQAYNSKVREATGGEVIKSTYEETTTDLSRVGGDVAYEAVDDKGSIEEQQGYETPKEIEEKEIKFEQAEEEEFELSFD